MSGRALPAGLPAWSAPALFLALALAPLHGALEAGMAGHVMVQIPLLVAAGFLAGRRLEPALEPWLERWNAGGIAGVLLAGFTLAFWMIPRWLDAALESPATDAAKHASLALLAGAPLAWSWRRLRPVARGVVKIEFLAMLFRLGWLYLIAPDRLCNNYLLADQVALGRGLLAAGAALGLVWLAPVFFGGRGRAPSP